MQHCSQCGEQIADDSRFCTKCGKQLKENNASSDTPVQQSTVQAQSGGVAAIFTGRRKWYILIGLIVLVIIGFAVKAYTDEAQRAAQLQQTIADEKASSQLTMSATELHDIVTSNQLKANENANKIITVRGVIKHIRQYPKTPDWYYVDLYARGDSVRCEFRDVYKGDLAKLSEDNYIKIKGRLLPVSDKPPYEAILTNCVIVK